MRNILLQIKFIIIFLVNVIYNIMPTFFMKQYFASLCGLKIGKKSYIHTRVKFFNIGKFQMGKNSVINFGSYLDNRRGINIGDNVSIAHNCKIYTLGHNIASPDFETIGSEVKIHDNVVIFANVQIMPGIEIGEGAIIMAGSVVVKNVAPYHVVGGNPAQYIKDREKNISYKIDYGFWFAL